MSEGQNSAVIFITNENFQSFGGQIKFQPFTKNYLKVKKYHKYIKISTNMLAVSAVYHYHDGKKFCFTNRFEKILDWCQQNHCQLKTGNFFPDIPLKVDYQSIGFSGVRKTYEYDIPAIENYAWIKIYPDGSFKHHVFPLQPFTVDIQTHYRKFKHFLKTYRKYILTAIRAGKFIPTITGGLDTRTLIGLYRDQIPKLNDYLCWDYKYTCLGRGKDDVVIHHGKAELEIAEKVVQRINLAGKRISSFREAGKRNVTIWGKFNDMAINFKSINDPEFVYKIIKHADDTIIDRYYIFASNEFLLFKQERCVTRCLLALLLIPDLLDIPLISTTKEYLREPNGYNFYEHYAEPIQRAREIMAAWGRKKCQNILR